MTLDTLERENISTTRDVRNEYADWRDEEVIV